MSDEELAIPDPEVAAVVRRAAARLAGEVDPGLPQMAELVLEEGLSPEPMRSFDPTVALGVAGFLLGAAQLGWQVYRDIRKDRKEAAEKAAKAAAGDGHALRSVIIRRIRLKLDAPPGVAESQRDRLLEVAVEEILAEAEEDGGGEA